MRVFVNKEALVKSLSLILNEEDSTLQKQIDDDDTTLPSDDLPIVANDQMGLQLTGDEPPVSDPKFIPENLEQLARSAYVISKEVPQGQMEFFYRRLHGLLDDCLDREASKGQELSEVSKAIRAILSESEHDDDDWGEPSDEELDAIDAGSEDVGEYDEEAEEAHRIAIIVSDIVKTIIAKKLHLVPIPDQDSEDGYATYPTVGHDGTGKLSLITPTMYVTASEDFAESIVLNSLSDESISGLFDSLKSSIGPGQAFSIIVRDVKQYLGKEGNPVTPELAAEMFANILADSVMKSSQGDIEAYRQEIDGMIANSISEDTVTFSLSGARMPENKNITLPASLVADELRVLRDNPPAERYKDDEPTQIEMSDEEYDQSYAEFKKDLDSQIKSDMQQFAEEQGVSPGAIYNLGHDLSVALGPRDPTGTTRAPYGFDIDKITLYSLIHDNIMTRFLDILERNIIVPKVLDSKGLSVDDVKSSDLKNMQDEVDDVLTDFLVDNAGYDPREPGIFDNQLVRDTFLKYRKSFVKELEKTASSPIFDVLPDYADVKDGARELSYFPAFTQKDTRETKGSAKDLAYLIRNIFNVGYDLKAQYQTMMKQARDLADAGKSEEAIAIRQEAREYNEEADKYLENHAKLISVIKLHQVSPKLVQSVISDLKRVK
jgi:hypothetical protein